MNIKENISRLFSGETEIHRGLGRPSPFQERFGLRIIFARSAHLCRVNGYASTPSRRFEFYSLSHLYDGFGRRWTPDGEENMSPGTMLLTFPGSINRYGGWNGQPFREDYVCFSGFLADLWRELGLLKEGCCDMGVVRQLLPLIELADDPSPDAEANANMLLLEILMSIHNRRQQGEAGGAIDVVIAEIKRRIGHWWTVDEMADFLHLSKDQFRRNFVKKTGMLPKKYVEELKLRRAADMLISTSGTISEIAAALGYEDPYHFSRRFKLRFGVAPQLYRTAGAGRIKPDFPEN